jgi:hypothetical protein
MKKPKKTEVKKEINREGRRITKALKRISKKEK